MNQVMKYLHGVDVNINLYAQFGIAMKLEHFLRRSSAKMSTIKIQLHSVLLSKYISTNAPFTK